MTLHIYPSPIVPAETIGQLRRIADAFYQEGAIGAAYLLAITIMDIVQATGKPSFYADIPFGVCPFCGDYEEVIQVADKKYGMCHEHRVYWYIGRNYLSLRHNLSDPLVYPLYFLNSYTQLSISDAFPKAICSCCGKFHMHAPWCLSEKQHSLPVGATEIPVE